MPFIPIVYDNPDPIRRGSSVSAEPITVIDTASLSPHMHGQAQANVLALLKKTEPAAQRSILTGLMSVKSLNDAERKTLSDQLELLTTSMIQLNTLCNYMKNCDFALWKLGEEPKGQITRFSGVLNHHFELLKATIKTARDIEYEHEEAHSDEFVSALKQMESLANLIIDLEPRYITEALIKPTSRLDSSAATVAK